MQTVGIAKYKNGQEKEIHRLIKKVYDEFVTGDCTEKGNEFFYNWIEPEKIAERQKNSINLWTAMVDTKIVGMIEIRDNTNITLLFVDKEFQGQGIAKKLFAESLKEIIKRVPNLRKFYVHASPYSVPVYKKMGFVETDNMQEQMGIKYLPMEMLINEGLKFVP